jgi:hypothetical protein
MGSVIWRPSLHTNFWGTHLEDLRGALLAPLFHLLCLEKGFSITAALCSVIFAVSSSSHLPLHTPYPPLFPFKYMHMQTQPILNLEQNAIDRDKMETEAGNTHSTSLHPVLCFPRRFFILPCVRSSPDTGSLGKESKRNTPYLCHT